MVTRILGIDPGSHRLGVGFIEKSGNSLLLLHAEVIETSHKKPLYERLHEIIEPLDTFLGLWKPAEVAVEDLFHSLNARSAFHLGMARGVAIACCLKKNIPIFEYAPTKVKSVVTGYGRADKAQVKKMVELQLGKSLALGFDATDALAVAICHATQNRVLRDL